MRLGAKKRPSYRVVVADSAQPPRRAVRSRSIGKYHPLEDPSVIEIDEERALYWLGVGAQPSEHRPRRSSSKAGIWQRFQAERRGEKAAS
ncbi:MAG: 30S ribosomal protein S16 [Actinomycetota bacterium]|nr:MAG: 30S ribosomal protein S16 [Actinomycetota bacterium]